MKTIPINREQLEAELFALRDAGLALHLELDPASAVALLLLLRDGTRQGGRYPEGMCAFYGRSTDSLRAQLPASARECHRMVEAWPDMEPAEE